MTLIIVALVLVAILFMVATVLDYSNVRNSRQTNKLTADVVASAGAQALAPDAVARPWRGVCSALTYLRANQPDLSLSVTYMDGNGALVSGSPCASLNVQECVPNVRTSWAWIRAVDSRYTFEIKSGYSLPDAAFPEDATIYNGDNGVAASGGCDQLAVISYKTDDAFFGGIAGVTRYDTAARSVARVRVTTEGRGVPAFLMLERAGCNVLSQQVGAGEQGIIVNPASATEPGVIHVDSAGAASAGCTGNNGPDGWAVYSASGPKILASPAANGTPGIIAINALQQGVPPAFYGGSTSSGLSPAPTPGRVVSRKPVDDKYNPSGGATISNVHAAAYADANRTIQPPSTYPAARPGAWTTLSTCNNPPSSAATKIFVNCPGGFSAGTAAAATTFSAATDVIFNGPVTVANNGQLYMPAARRIVVGGTTTAGLALAGGGQLGVNSVTPFANTDAGVDAACNGREGPAWARTTELVIFGGASSGSNAGALSLGGRAALCQTFVYLAGPKTSNPTYAPRQITNGTYYPTCVATTPCPLTNGNPITNAHLVISGRVKWSAPNQLSGQPAPGSVGVEDLALWTETATLSEIKSGGVLQARGVFFLPNDRIEMRSPALAAPQDAQFIARSLQLLQGAVTMQPSPGNNVQIPVLGGVGMVR